MSKSTVEELEHRRSIWGLKSDQSKNFRRELEAIINRYSLENGCNTSDFILADYLCNCLLAFDNAVNSRERWYGR